MQTFQGKQPKPAMEPSQANLATKEFWSDVYLSGHTGAIRPSDAIPFERCLCRILEEYAPANAGELVIELGCAPGRWLVFYGERFNTRLEGLEYTKLGVQQTSDNLRACGLDGIVHSSDFWEFTPEHPYDVVLSLGFIEHFVDIELAFARHIDLVRKGGRLVLSVPNYQGLNKLLQRWCDPEWLALHNLDAMGHRRYQGLAARYGLEMVAWRYFGGFDPDLISVRQRGRRLLAPFWHLRRLRAADKLNAKWLSSGLVIVFNRPLG